MGKASRWFRGLLGLNKSDPLSPPAPNSDPKQPSPKRKWSFVKSSRETTKNHHIHSKSAGERIPSRGGAPPPPQSPVEERHDTSKHTMAMATSTVPAANAVAAVVRLTSGGRSASNGTVKTAVDVNNFGFGNREEWAAIKLQSHFRAYLSRRALRALKSLVKLQALVRGHIVRKQYAERLRHTQAILRAQARARALRAQIYESSHATIESTHFHHPGPATPEKLEHSIRKSTIHEQSFIFKQIQRNGSISHGGVVTDKERVRFHYSMDEGSREQRVYSTRSSLANDEKSDKILEIDIGKPHITPKRRNLFQSSLYPSASDPKSHSFTTSKDSTIHQMVTSPSSYEVQSLSPKNYTDDVEETSFCTAANNSPQFYSASSKGGSSIRGPFTPIRSAVSRSCLSGYSYYPSYMSYTESSRAKVRSLSAPKQRPQLEKSKTTKRFSVHGGYGEHKDSSALHANFTNKAYPGSGRLDRLGMPIGADGVGFSGGLWYKY